MASKFIEFFKEPPAKELIQDKEKVDKIYYYVGDYTDLEEKENIENVTIMWEK